MALFGKTLNFSLFFRNGLNILRMFVISLSNGLLSSLQIAGERFCFLLHIGKVGFQLLHLSLALFNLLLQFGNCLSLVLNFFSFGPQFFLEFRDIIGHTEQTQQPCRGVTAECVGGNVVAVLESREEALDGALCIVGPQCVSGFVIIEVSFAPGKLLGKKGFRSLVLGELQHTAVCLYAPPVS